jgi:lipopolysaccharide biosynthesis glycosyltransferase
MAAAHDWILASATDDAFAPAASTALLSAAVLSSRRPRCFLIDCGIADATKLALRRTFAAHDIPLTCRRIDVTEFAGLPLTDHFSVATYARLAVAHLASDLASRTLYVDADTLTIASVDELVAVDLKGCPVGAVQDPIVRFVSAQGGVAGWARLGIPPGTGQFNAGVLLIDNESWQSARLSEHASQLLREYPDEATFADQGALNAVLAGRWLPLEDRWNVAVPRSAALQTLGHVVSRHSLISLKDLGILHYLGTVKPWQPGYAPSAYRHMYVKAYRQFAPFGAHLEHWNPLRWARVRP